MSFLQTTQHISRQTNRRTYLVSIKKCVTGALRGSCECAHDKFIDRDVKLVINGRSGASGTSEMHKKSSKCLLLNRRPKEISTQNDFYY